MKIGLVSWGGCGTWLLRDALAIAGHEVEATHSIRPDFFSGGKVIYLYGNPLNSIVSFKRRNDQSFGNFWFKNHALNLGLVPSDDLSWNTIIKEQKDPFLLQQHFDNWYNYKDRKYEIAFVRYENVLNIIDQLCDWLGIESLNLQFKERQSNWHTLSDAEQEILLDIYGPIYWRWVRMDNLEIK